MARASFSSLHTVGPASGKTPRGSRKRLRRIRLRGNTPPGLIVLALVLLAAVILGVWLELLHHDMHHWRR
jgi:hypothetical protein